MSGGIAPPSAAGTPTAAEISAARRAGWRRADLVWERLAEAGNAALLQGDPAEAAVLFRRAGRIALWRFRRTDPRRATTLANLGLVERLAGRETRARRRYAEARRIWSGVDAFIAGMDIRPRARSSLFHLRMEARHRGTFRQNSILRMNDLACETAAALAALERGDAVACHLYERWRSEKPPVFDDSRKLLAAALLVAIWTPRKLVTAGRVA